MHRHISSNELYESIQTLLTPEHTRKIVDAKILKDYGDVRYKCFNTGQGISYCSLQSDFKEDVCISGAEKGEYSFLAFNTGHPVRLKTLSDNKEFFINHNLFFDGTIQNGACSCGFYERNKTYTNHFIVIKNELFHTYCGQSSCQTPQEDSFFIRQANTAGRRQLMLLGDIFALEKINEPLQELYLESKLLELLYTSFQESGTPQTAHEKSNLTSDDIHSLRKAKVFLLKDLQNPPSIKELARKAAINEFKLKKGFKQLFGNTIYGMLHEHRLEEAKQLLLNNDINVQEAATLVGYSSLGHFSKIFKARYGVLPLVVKHRKTQ